MAKGLSGTKGRPVQPSAFVMMLCILAFFIFSGFIFTLTILPSDANSGPSTNSVFSMLHTDSIRSGTRSLSKKILNWLPRHHLTHLPPESEAGDPDWDQEFWTPIDLEDADDPMVTMCMLNFKDYAKSPHLYPMFRDVTAHSHCVGSNKKREKLSVLIAKLNEQAGTPHGRVVKPSGFVFHESRVGSTLVANTLASDPWSMVFSESAPVANAILHCNNCDRARHVQLVRDIITLMGHSPFHKRLFFKFQSATTPSMSLVLEAFPESSWAFVYRQPVQTMMSHMDPKKGQAGAPCLRSMHDPPPKVQSAVDIAVTSGRPPKEAWCAAHLNMLCSSALEAYSKYGMRIGPDEKPVQRGLLVNYEALPGVVARVLLQLFGVDPSPKWVTKMSEESSFYSKGRGSAQSFSGDSEDKDKRATSAIQQYAKSILEPTFRLLEISAVESVRNAADTYSLELPIDLKSGVVPDWKALRSFPVMAAVDLSKSVVEERSLAMTEGSMSVVSGGVDPIYIPRSGHSVFPVVPFVPWAPFSNTHNSKKFFTPNCPDEPEVDYPRAFSIVDITNNWNTDNTEIPEFHYDSLCHFDYMDAEERKKAEIYRNAEKPFVVYNMPEVNAVVKKWSDIDYLEEKLGSKSYRTEVSKNNHFMYWNAGAAPRLRGSWKPPTSIESTTFENWLETAMKGQNKTVDDRDHKYFRVSSDAGNKWLFDELPFFKPVKSLLMVVPGEQQGIHCRFGMRGVISEAHFDGSRNSIAMLGGMRRWILTHPSQCKEMHMLPKSHPSGRHSEVDWSKPDTKAFPNFVNIQANEVIMQPGDVLYLPTYWIHYIVSLNVNFQCNTRSGRTKEYDGDIHKCGF